MIKKLCILTLLLAFVTTQAYSYIDPGSGSYVIQVLITVFVGASVGIRIFWRRIKDFFSGKRTVSPELQKNETEKTDEIDETANAHVNETNETDLLPHTQDKPQS
jgi:hypothetical protein